MVEFELDMNIIWVTGLEACDAVLPTDDGDERVALLRFRQNGGETVWYGIPSAGIQDFIDALTEVSERLKGGEEPTVTLTRIPSNGNGD